MNYAKINQEVVKAFIEGTKYGNAIPGYWINDNYLFITIDGFKAYILPKDKVYFNTDNIKDFANKPFDFNAVRSCGCDIKATYTYVKRPGATLLLRKFKGERDGKKWNLYIDDRMLKPLEREYRVIYTQLYDEKEDMSIQPVAAFVEKNGERIPLMLVLPVRVYEEEDFD